MIPIRDQIRSKSYPVVTRAIIGMNVLVYLFQMTLGENIEQFIYTYGLVPARYSVPGIAAHFTFGEQAFALLSFMFLHGGFFHLLGNMWFLHIFGDNVEDRMGPTRFLLFYLLCGWVSGFAHLWSNWTSTVPTIGASGAIAGVMGAYLILFPGARIITLIPIFFIPYFIEIPAVIFLGIWFLFQFFYAGMPGPEGGGESPGGPTSGGLYSGWQPSNFFHDFPRAASTRSSVRHLRAAPLRDFNALCRYPIVAIWISTERS